MYIYIYIHLHIRIYFHRSISTNIRIHIIALSLQACLQITAHAGIMYATVVQGRQRNAVQCSVVYGKYVKLHESMYIVCMYVSMDG